MQTDKFTSALELQKQLIAFNDHLKDFDEVFGKELGHTAEAVMSAKVKPSLHSSKRRREEDDYDEDPEDDQPDNNASLKAALGSDFHMDQDMAIQRKKGFYNNHTFGLYSELAYGSDRREFLELYRYRLVRRIEALNLEFSKL